MKILYILKQEPDETLEKIMNIHRKTHDVKVIDMRKENNYGRLVDEIERCDKIIPW